MKTGKISESVLKRSVLKRIKTKRPEVVAGPAIGGDFAAFDIESEERIVISTNGLPDIPDLPPWYGIMSAVGSLVTSGARPIGVTVGGYLSEDMEEATLKALTDDIEKACSVLGIQALGGHTQVSAAVSKPVLTVTAAGAVDKEKMLTSAGARPGQDILVTKWIAMGGTAILANAKEMEIAKKYKQDLINDAKYMKELMSVIPEAAVAVKSGATAIHDISQGGIYNALWEMAGASGVGLTIDIKKIPLRQETVEICEIFEINPYRLFSGGSLLIACDDGEKMAEELIDKNINAVVIGRFTDSNDRIITNEDEITYLDSPKPDEILRI